MKNKKRKRKKQNTIIEFLKFLSVESASSRFLNHIKTFVFRGTLAVIPFALTVIAIRFLYLFLDKRLTQIVQSWIGFSFPGLGIIFVVLVLYLFGLIASNVMGRQVFSTLERISNRIPLIKTTYQVGKQLSATLSLPEKQVFKHAVLVEYPKADVWTIGFVTGIVYDEWNDERLLKVFIPFPPNPATGTLVMVKSSQVRDPDWSVEEAMRTVISAGIIGPTEIGRGKAIVSDTELNPPDFISTKNTDKK